MNVDLGCGNGKELGFIGIDKRPGKHVDIVCDIEEGIPLPDNSVDILLANEILEHVRDLMFVMDEIYRVCKDGAKVAIRVPHYQSHMAWQDPTHVRAFTPNTFDYWDPSKYLWYVYRPKSIFSIQQLEYNPLTCMEGVLRVVKSETINSTLEEVLNAEGIQTNTKDEGSVRVTTKSSKGRKTSTSKTAKRKGSKKGRVGQSTAKKAC